MLGKVGIAVQLLLGLSLGLLGSLVDGVAFLPPELAAAQEMCIRDRPHGIPDAAQSALCRRYGAGAA